MVSRLTRAVVGVALMLIWATTTAAAEDEKAALKTYSATIVDAIDAQHATLTFRDNGPDMTRNAGADVTADASAVKNKLGEIAVGDEVTLTVAAGTPARITMLELAVGKSDNAGLVFLGWLAALLGLAALAAGGNPLEFIIGADRRYSNSKTQLFLWFMVVISAYLTFVVCRVAAGQWNLFGNVMIPENLLVLSGLSALSFAGAKAITTRKVNAAVAAGNASPKVVDSGGPDITTDLFQNDQNEADIGDFQMILVTLIAIGMFLFSVFHALSGFPLKHLGSLPDVDSTLLSMFGLGQGAYLIKKLASNPGEG